MITTSKNIPTSDADLYSDETLRDPWRIYRDIRDIGSVVFLDKINMYAVGRYAEVKEVLGCPSVFSSGHGVMMNEPMNQAVKGVLLCTDGEEHSAMRRVLMKPVMPSALRDNLRETVTAHAEALADRLVAQASFDAATELAQYLPLTIVSHAVGLPDEGREKMLEWAAASFNCIGPMNQRTIESFGTIKEMVGYAMNECVRGKLKPGGWAEMLHDAADRGEIAMEKASLMALDYMGPALDTTIFATSSAIWLFANNPDQWDIVRNNPSIIPNAINEIVRIESPIQGFSRYSLAEYTLSGTTIPALSRVITLYGSANRDERKWGDPETFNVRRANAGDHVGFGYGDHACVGMNLARLEITAVLTALAKRVRRFELGETQRALINTLRGFSKLEVAVH
ncbi:cytochrome P450 [Xanthobacter sp. AM11]|uniref:cytochrome P450 n=1 Tax=Xanthobacter sp. AM11 TaxID=3380643 RepID=UPI0039BFAA5E